MQILTNEIKKLINCETQQIVDIFNNLTIEELNKCEFLLKADQVCDKYFFLKKVRFGFITLKQEKIIPFRLVHLDKYLQI